MCGCLIMPIQNTCYSWFYHTWLITYWWPSLSLCRLFSTHGLILSFYDPSSSLKNLCLFLYATFNPILVCTCDFWPQTHVHRDVCISPNVFGVFLIGVWINWLLAFQIPWEFSDSNLHYPLGVLYKETLGYIEERGIEEQRNYSPLLPQFAYTWLCIPLSLWRTLCSSQACCWVKYQLD